MLGHRGRMLARRLDQLSPAQEFQCGLHGALGQAGCFREHAQTRGDRLPLLARSLAVEVEINEIRGWLAIVADDIAHQNVENVVVDWNGFAVSGHGSGN